MINFFMTLFVAALFVVLTPGILLTIPPTGTPLTVAMVHGLIFAVVYYFIQSMLTSLAEWTTAQQQKLTGSTSKE